MSKRRNQDAAFKARVALEPLKGEWFQHIFDALQQQGQKCAAPFSLRSVKAHIEGRVNHWHETSVVDPKFGIVTQKINVYTMSPGAAEFDGLTAGLETIQLCP